ncbi:pyroglutamyl-peptidase I [Pseudobacteriovorax antillogorgiicola]|uniref:Pyroglutamyl-peptidase I n=1 Tax=Pseudobacteriovorax antillogorgiicola TaxID=1513793 RepID=A0A1Y6BBJ6_9BACT|nr:pyroglutamyl-peptidase I [Pseudobacteriovorax antillogorgiicola]TCS57305.1 pyroglutamyl-peptidase [Pseudobacteriovorax antillogorgiicola]SMF02760.1 pyroglutamyl-peptidase [Pseudobacteriovorax antillogorgiicola]
MTQTSDQVLLTGFQPFANHKSNPSAEVAAHVAAENGYDFLVLPVGFKEAAQILLHQLEKNSYHTVIALGLAANRSSISLERIALNLIDARIPDEFGQQPIDEPLIAEAPLAIHTSLPIKKIHQHLEKERISSEVSYSAGTYVCNAVFFHLLHHRKTVNPSLKCGFIHIPLEELMPLEITKQAIKIATDTTISSESDTKGLSVGTIS